MSRYRCPECGGVEVRVEARVVAELDSSGVAHVLPGSVGVPRITRYDYAWCHNIKCATAGPLSDFDTTRNLPNPRLVTALTDLIVWGTDGGSGAPCWARALEILAELQAPSAGHTNKEA